jgi:hypothetical protein
LLHRILNDWPFAEYITQRIDNGDFNYAVANRLVGRIKKRIALQQEETRKTK